MMKNLSLLLPLVLLLDSCRQSFAHYLRGRTEVGHYYHTRHRHVLLAVDAVESVDDDSNGKEWILTAHDEDGADYVGSPALFSTSNTVDQEQEQERYEIITTLLNRQNEVEDSSSSTSSLSV